MSKCGDAAMEGRVAKPQNSICQVAAGSHGSSRDGVGGYSARSWSCAATLRHVRYLGGFAIWTRGSVVSRTELAQTGMSLCNDLDSWCFAFLQLISA